MVCALDACQSVRNHMTTVRDATLVFQHVGETDGARLLAALDLLLKDADFASSATGKSMLRDVERASQRTLDILYGTRVASLGSLKAVWPRLPALWAKHKVRLDLTWERVLNRITAFLEASGKGTPDESDIVLPRMNPADEEYVAKLHELAGLDGSLRLMFIEADDADKVYVADVVDEDGLDFMLRGYPYTHVRCQAAHDALGIGEFRVYVVGGRRIFRTDGLVAATDPGVLGALQSGKNLPRMASLRTASVIRLTFTLRAVLDPAFRDFLRDLGGVPASQVSWDIPLYAEQDVKGTLDKIQEQFGYAVQIYQIIDTPEQNIYASANPEAHVARVLSAKIRGFRKARVEHVRLPTNGLAKAASALEPKQRQALDHVLHAGKCLGYYLVTRAGEVTPKRGAFQCDLPSVVRANVPAEPVSVYVVDGDIPQIVSADVLDLDANGDGHIDAIEMSTMGMLGVDGDTEVEDDRCPYGHCPECLAEGDYEDGDCIVCVNGCRCLASEWEPCDCGPLAAEDMEPEDDDDDEESEMPAKLTARRRTATDLRSPAEKALGLQEGELYGADEDVDTDMGTKTISGYKVEFIYSEYSGNTEAWVKGLGPIDSDSNMDDLLVNVEAILKRVRAGETLRDAKKAVYAEARARRKQAGAKRTASDLFTASDLMREFRDLSEEDAEAIIAAIDDASSPSEIGQALRTIDKLLGTHGVESIEDENAVWHRYWGNSVASYCNTGDTYATTILYSPTDGWLLTSYGDFVEARERQQHERTSTALHTRTHKKIAQHIIDSAWRNLIDTYGVDEAHVTRADIADYVECPPEWHRLSQEDQAAVYTLAVSMVPADGGDNTARIASDGDAAAAAKALSPKQIAVLHSMQRKGGKTHSGRGGWPETVMRALEKRGFVRRDKESMWETFWSLTDEGRALLPFLAVPADGAGSGKHTARTRTAALKDVLLRIRDYASRNMQLSDIIQDVATRNAPGDDEVVSVSGDNAAGDMIVIQVVRSDTNGIHVGVTSTDTGDTATVRVQPGGHPDPDQHADNEALNDAALGVAELVASLLARHATTASVQMTTAKRQTINAELRKIGMDGNVRFRSAGQALALVASVLNRYGYEIDDTLTGHVFNKPSGTSRVDVAESGEDPFSPISVTNTVLFVQWSPFGDTKDTSVICYLS